MNKFRQLVASIFLLTITTAAFSQTETMKFANANFPINNITKDSIAVNGYDLIEYFINKRAVKGRSKYETIHKGIKYHFFDEKNKNIFNVNPEKYLPQYGGYCAYGLAMEPNENGYLPGKYPVNPETFKIIDNKLYLFYNKRGYNFLNVWESDEKTNLLKADKRWKIINKLNSPN